MSLLYVRSNNGTLIPLESVARLQTAVGPMSVSHYGQLPAVTLSFNLRPGFALGDAVDQIKAAASASLPSTMSTNFQGAAQAFQDSLQGLGLILLIVSSSSTSSWACFTELHALDDSLRAAVGRLRRC
jgi:HAE1 family hydrophobic/amphiphilic exporter-1